MTTLTIQDVSRRSGLSGPTLRYYEEIGLIGPIARDPSSSHRRYREQDLDTLQVLACLRAMGVGIEEMRTYQANRELGHAKPVEAEIKTLRMHLNYLRAKAALWDARSREDADAEAEANSQVQKVLPRLEEVVLG